MQPCIATYLKYLVPTPEPLGAASDAVGLYIVHKYPHSIPTNQVEAQVVRRLLFFEDDKARFTGRREFVVCFGTGMKYKV